MINLAGNKEADKFIKEELFLAGIPMETVCLTGSEVPYTIQGRIGKWTLRRAWYYWIASTKEAIDGVPLEIAMKLHNTPHPVKDDKLLGDVIRSGGNCTCPAPDEYGAQPVYDDELDNKLVELGYKKEFFKFLNKEVVHITVGDISKLCNEGKLKVERYVDSYHIDDQIGLVELAKVLKELK